MHQVVVDQDQLTRGVDAVLLLIAALAVGTCIGWLRDTLPAMICGAWGHPEDMPPGHPLQPGTTLRCELRPLHHGAHLQGLVMWPRRLPGRRPDPRPCRLGHVHRHAASRDECEAMARRLSRLYRVPPDLALPTPRR